MSSFLEEYRARIGLASNEPKVRKAERPPRLIGAIAKAADAAAGD
jgi:hypothetical protein